MNKNVYKVIIKEEKYKKEWDCYVCQILNVQIVIGLDNLKILLDAFPKSEWELAKANGEGSYYE